MELLDMSQQTKVARAKNDSDDIVSESENEIDLVIHPRPRCAVGSRLKSCQLLQIKGSPVLKWVFVLTVIVLLIFLMPRDRKASSMKQLDKATILLWNEKTTARGCPCILTTKQDYATPPIDAVVVNADRPFSLLGLNKIKRAANFLLVYAATNPLTLAQNPLMEASEFYFNFSMTYRMDSDLVLSKYYFTNLQNAHQRVQVFEQPDRNSVKNLTGHLASLTNFRLEFKPLQAAYLSYERNAHTESQAVYLEELRKHMQLNEIQTCQEIKECLPYKFMLIFDMSFCPDFVHSQVYMALANFMVPVLVGSADISHLVPPGSYINGNGFLSPQKLAQFLTNLGTQAHIYEQYFWWHSKYQLHQIREPYCNLCNELMKPRRERPPQEFQDWWNRYKCLPSTEHIHWTF